MAIWRGLLAPLNQYDSGWSYSHQIWQASRIMRSLLQSFISPLFALSLSGMLLNPLLAYAQTIELPDIGEAAAGVATPLQERKTGEAVMRNIRRAGGIIEDPLLNQYINHLGYQLVSANNSQMSDFHFFIINDKSINAFALPGGYIGVHYGLILATTSESELASVLAHEIAHVTQRHHARAYDYGGGSNVPIIAALIAAIVLGANNSEIGEAAMASVAAGTIQSRINFTRANEKEADHIGIELLASSGFDPHSMARFFEHLHQASRLYGPQAPEFLSTHPVTQTRIADSRNRASHYEPKPVTNSVGYHLMQSRLTVLANSNAQQLSERYAEQIRTGKYLNKNAAQYGHVLALIEAGHINKARVELTKLINSDPQRIAYLLTRAELETKANKHKQALKYYASALSLYPDNSSLTQGYVKTLIQAKQAGKARTLIQNYLRSHTDTPVLYQLLAEAETHLGNSANAHVALGEFYYRNGQTHEAINHLKMALANNKFGFHEISRIEARLQEFKQELAALAKAKRFN